MTTDHHTPIVLGAAANAAIVNYPLAELDEAIEDILAIAPDALTGTNTDNTNNDVSILAHGFTPILPDEGTEYFDGEGNWTVPAGTGVGIDGHAITEEGGADLPQRAKLDFIGAAVTASNGASATEVNINGAVLAKNVEVLAATKTLTDASEPVQSLDPDGAGRDVVLPAEAVTNPYFIIHNIGDEDVDLTVKNDATDTIATVSDDEVIIFICDGVDWFGFPTAQAVDVSIADAGDIITATNVEAALQENRTALDLNTTHRTSDGSDHGYIDQDVTSGASPTLDGDGFTGIDADDVDIADAGDIITATDVEDALQENRTAVDLNTTHRTSTGADHSYLDQAVTIAGTPQFAGVQLGGTGATHTLDDYEEGTWTPVVYGSTSAGTYTYNIHPGIYTKIGRLVVLHATCLDINPVSAGSGDLRISGIPFAIMNNTSLHSTWNGNVRLNSLDGAGLGGTYQCGVRAIYNTSYLIIQYFDGDIVSSVDITKLINGSDLGINVTYMTD